MNFNRLLHRIYQVSCFPPITPIVVLDFNPEFIVASFVYHVANGIVNITMENKTNFETEGNSCRAWEAVLCV